MALDVDLPSAELGGQSYVLAFLADRQGQLVVGDHDGRGLAFLVDQDHFDLRGGQRAGDQLAGFLAPVDDVDLFAGQFIDDCLYAAASRADAGSDGIHVLIVRADGDLRSGTGFSRDALDLDDAFLDLGDFEFEQSLDQAGVRAGQEHLGTLRRLLDVHDVDLDAFVHAIAFAGDLLVGSQDAFGSAHAHEHGIGADALHDACDDFGLAGDIIVVDHASLGLADALHHDLLGGLGCDAAEISGGHLIFDDVAEFVGGVDLLRLFQARLGERIFHFLDDVASHEDVDVAGLAVDVDPHVLGRAVILLICRNQCALDGVDQDILGNALFSFQSLDGFDEFHIHAFLCPP